MNRQARTAKRGLLAAALAVPLGAALSACSSPGDLTITNESAVDVTVVIDDEATEVLAGGGVVILGSGCTTTDVTVDYRSGTTVVVPGPVCPDQEIVVRTSTVDLRP